MTTSIFHRRSIVILFFVLSACTLRAANPPGPAEFGPQWASLVGTWKTEPGPGPSGICAFHFDLARHVLVRTNHAELSAGALAHEDLMILSPEPATDKARAIYYDNEGHVIEYDAEWSDHGKTLSFTSKPAPGPQFRLTYRKTGTDTFAVTFEMAPAGQPGAYKTYTSGKISRVK